MRARSSSSGDLEGRSRSNRRDMNPERYGAKAELGSDGMNSPNSETTASIRGSFPPWTFSTSEPMSLTSTPPCIAEALSWSTGIGSASPTSTTSFHFGEGNNCTDHRKELVHAQDVLLPIRVGATKIYLLW